jgi:hypothetical protein
MINVLPWISSQFTMDLHNKLLVLPFINKIKYLGLGSYDIFNKTHLSLQD